MDKGKLNGKDTSENGRRWYYYLALFAQIPALVAIVLILILFGKYRGGFGRGSNLDNLFNFHPLCMTLGMVFFYGDAILVYRLFPNTSKFAIKMIHGLLLILSLILSSIGLSTVFENHAQSKPPKPDLYSLHSWIGITAVSLFGLQWVCGFLTFLFPQLSERVRQAYMPSHKFWGKTIFIFAIIAVMMGIVEYCAFEQLFSPGTKFQETMLNMAGVMVLMFAVIVLYLVGNDNFQRPKETDDDEHLPLTE
ncbi:unnamed protein product [Rotaria magnacalcarata]